MAAIRNFVAEQISFGKEAGDSLLKLIAPDRCMKCLKEGSWFCADCRQQPFLFQQRCLICAEEKPRGTTCPECSSQTPITGIVSAGAYHSVWLRRGIHWLKFKGVRPVASILANLLAPHLTKIAPISQLATEATLIPMPLNRDRYLERGFNQSEDIALELEKLTSIPVSHILSRPKATYIQTQLPHELRQRNVSEAFAATQKLPSHIRLGIIVDDVATTGATLSAAAAALQAPDDIQVWAATLARG